MGKGISTKVQDKRRTELVKRIQKRLNKYLSPKDEIDAQKLKIQKLDAQIYNTEKDIKNIGGTAIQKKLDNMKKRKIDELNKLKKLENANNTTKK